MKKKIVAMALAVGMSFVVLTGCDSGSQPVVEEQTEVETDVEAEPTEEATEESTEEQEATEESETTEPTEDAEPEKDVLIPLSMQLVSLDEDWRVAFSPEKYDMFYNVQKITVDQLPQSENEIGKTGELAQLVDVDTSNLELSEYADMEVRYPCAFFFDVHTSNFEEDNRVFLQALIDGKWYPILDFVPLFYNSTKGTIVGIDINPSNYTVGEVKFSEVYFFKDINLAYVKEVPEEESEQYFDAYLGW